MKTEQLILLLLLIAGGFAAGWLLKPIPPVKPPSVRIDTTYVPYYTDTTIINVTGHTKPRTDSLYISDTVVAKSYLNMAVDSLRDGRWEMPFKIPETNLYITTPFLVWLDTTVQKVQFRYSYQFPREEQEVNIVVMPDTVMIPAYKETITVPAQLEFYQQGWFVVGSNIVSILGTAYIMTR